MRIGDLLFVYGTLRPGEMRYQFMANHIIPIGDAVLHGAAIYDVHGAFPALKITKGLNDIVHGFVVKIKDDELRMITDRIEGHPLLFHREEVETSRGKAWVYIAGDRFECPEEARILNGDWTRRHEERKTA